MHSIAQWEEAGTNDPLPRIDGSADLAEVQAVDSPPENVRDDCSVALFLRNHVAEREASGSTSGQTLCMLCCHAENRPAA
jgi:hypothetical protein